LYARAGAIFEEQALHQLEDVLSLKVETWRVVELRLLRKVWTTRC